MKSCFWFSYTSETDQNHQKNHKRIKKHKAKIFLSKEKHSINVTLIYANKCKDGSAKYVPLGYCVSWADTVNQ